MLSERAVMLPKAVLIGLQPNLNKPDKNFIWKGESASFDAAVSPLSPLFAKSPLHSLSLTTCHSEHRVQILYLFTVQKKNNCVIFYCLCLI